MRIVRRMTDREFGVNLVDEVAESGPNWITGADQGAAVSDHLALTKLIWHMA